MATRKVQRYEVPFNKAGGGAQSWTAPGDPTWAFLRVEVDSNPAARAALTVFGQRVTDFPFIIDLHCGSSDQQIDLRRSTPEATAADFIAIITVVEVTP
jgi:hypothetical protein